MDVRALCCLLKNADCIDPIKEKREEIVELIPKTGNMAGYDQKNRFHCYDLWAHSLHTVCGLPRGLEDDMLYLAALLHDIGKPDCCMPGEYEGKPNMHYYGHPRLSMEIVKNEIVPILEREGEVFSEEEKKRLYYYVEYHDDRISLREKHLKRHLNMVSFEDFQKLMLLQIADAKAHIFLPEIRRRIEICEKWAGKYGIEVYCRVKQKESGNQIRIVAGFAGTGKSEFCKGNQNAIDFVCMPFKYSNFFELAGQHGTETIKADDELDFVWSWQEQYVDALMDSYEKYTDEMFIIPSERKVLEYLEQKEIPFFLVYPCEEARAEYVERYRKRGNSETFLEIFGEEESWKRWMRGVRKPYRRGISVELKEGQFLSDVIPPIPYKTENIIKEKGSYLVREYFPQEKLETRLEE